MRYKPLGSTGLHVSKISLGTVELGIDYGFPGTDQYQKPDEAQAIRLLHRSVDLGINLFDTHRDYGVSEQLIGRAMVQMTERPYIASKVTLPPDPGYTGVFPPPPDPGLSPPDMRRAILGSIEASLTAVRVDTIDLMQVHNTTMASLERDDIIACLQEARDQGKIRFIGASAYGRDVPMRS